MTEQWQELKETITEMRDSNGTCTQQEVCKFLVNYMEILEKQMQEPCDNVLTLAERVVTQVTEDIDNFIFTTIQPWCEVKEQRIISKRDLEQALTQYFRKEPCEDVISRKEVLNQIFYSTDNSGDVVLGSVLRHRIENLPSVKPQEPKTIHSSTYGGVSWGGTYKPQEPKTGHWIGHREHCENLGVIPSGLGAYEWCSNCDCGIDVREWHRNHYNYCPNCGAIMVEPQESELENPFNDSRFGG